MYGGEFFRRLLCPALALSCSFSAVILAAGPKDDDGQELPQLLEGCGLIVQHPEPSENAEKPPTPRTISTPPLETETRASEQNADGNFMHGLTFGLERLNIEIAEETVGEGEGKKILGSHGKIGLDTSGSGPYGEEEYDDDSDPYEGEEYGDDFGPYEREDTRCRVIGPVAGDPEVLEIELISLQHVLTNDGLYLRQVISARQIKKADLETICAAYTEG